MADTKEAVLMTEIARSEHRQWTRATVTRDGRIFVSYPRWSDNVFVSVGELLPSGEVRSYPDEDWNKWHHGDSAENKFICVQSVYVDLGRGLFRSANSLPWFKLQLVKLVGSIEAAVPGEGEADKIGDDAHSIQP